jgi:hypothetical protein
MFITDWKPWGNYARRLGNHSISKSVVSGAAIYELWSFDAQKRSDRENIFNEKMLFRGKSFNECVKWYEEKIG